MRGELPLRQAGAIGTWFVVLLLLVLVILWLFPHIFLGTVCRPINVKQQAQFHSMDAALELFNAEFDAYPPSDANDSAGQPYCGAMKLAEALMGKDLLGFHTRSGFRVDGLDPNGGVPLYPKEPNPANMKARIGSYLQAQNAQAHRLVEVYGKGNTGPFREDLYVLCDTYIRKQASGAKTGMPILYYRADPKGTAHDLDDPNNPANIYDYRDNLALLKLGVPWNPAGAHPLAEPKRFYLNTKSEKIRDRSVPYRADTYILISAGWDGLYGTADDICNFDWNYREQ
ncbi:MAG: hypothetical protein JW993_05460 [Sedimentisphaerales bacterium]|nr:hypothetical protein [Sedimentisphaerales bacterium]